MKNFKIIVEYDGTHYYGWQRQKDRITVQGQLEKYLSKILNQNIKIKGSGRTDAGVHAYGQVANFFAETKLTCTDIQKGLNSIIKEPVIIKKCCEVDKNFNSQYSAVSKEYHYVILNRPVGCAIGKNYIWHIKQPLDLSNMKACCDLLLGKHDFKSFEGTGSPRSSSVREIFSVDIKFKKKNLILFKITADGFLKHMVRNIIGTLVLAGKSKITVQDFKHIMAAKDRQQAGATAPPHGLFLVKVNY